MMLRYVPYKKVIRKLRDTMNAYKYIEVAGPKYASRTPRSTNSGVVISRSAAATNDSNAA